MLPLYDENPSRTRPVVTWSLIALNVIIFLWEVSATNFFANIEAFRQILTRFGAVPVHVITSISTFDPTPLYTIFTSMFLHGGLLHIFGNMLFLFIFGDNVEDRVGHFKFLATYLIYGVAGSFVHSYISLTAGAAEAFTPSVGASGAISGVLGSYLVFFPRVRVVTIVFLGYFFFRARIPAIFYLGFWFLLQFLYGVVGGGGNVAYWAHIGGFLAGALLGLAHRAIAGVPTALEFP